MEMLLDKEKRAQYLAEGITQQTDTRYWKIAPGDNAWQWDDCRKQGFIAIGWSEFGDLSNVDRAEFDKRFDKLHAKYPDWTRNGCNQLWSFVNIKEGDRIIANHGTTEVIGIGTVTGPYHFDPNAEDYGHILPVKWDDLRLRQVNKPGWRRTLVELDEQDFQEILNTTPAPGPAVPTPPEIIATNTILYGPPGTGKTYETIERAVRIIEPDFQGENHAAYKVRFDELRAEGQIEFITFHQSYSYEDFVEGLRPVVVDEESSEVGYKYAPGVFKSFALRALFDCLKPTTGIISFPVLWDRLVDQIENDPDKEYPGLKKASYRLNLTAKGNIEGTNVTSSKTTKPFFCSKVILEKVFAAKPNAESITTTDVTEVIEPGCHSHFVAAMFNELKRIQKTGFKENTESRNTPLPQNKREEIAISFLQNTDRGAYKPKPANEPRPPYVLIIDEINRGNISKILGELITLIEPDKRLGAEHELRVKLPYTKHYFGVPSNLHILGTMNTADKSIALVDVALRRRFEFAELRPDFNICKDLPQPMRDVLNTLNRRICLRKDRDHQIGHSYFMKVTKEDEFNLAFARHVIPLLQEYFYNDWEGLRFVLGVQSKPSPLIVPLKDGDSADSRSSWQWSFEKENKKASEENFLQILAANTPAA